MTEAENSRPNRNGQVGTAFGQRLVLAFEIFSLASVNLFYYKKVLSSFLTGQDTIFQIDTSRFNSLSGMINVLTEPLLGRDDTIGGDIMYRPLESLQSGLEYALWGVNSYGYHLFDILLHITVVILIFWLVRKLLDSDAIAWVSAILFSIHPAVLRSLTGPHAAGDIQASAFFLLMLITFLAYQEGRHKALLYLSLSSYLLALLSKETAYIFWLLLLVWTMIIQNGTLPFKRRLVKAVKATWVFPVLAVPVFILRTFVLHGLGGYKVETNGIRGLWSLSVDHGRDYFLYFFSERTHIFSFLPPTVTRGKMVLFLFLLLFVCAVLLRRRIVDFARKTYEGKVMVFMVFWLGIFLALILLTRTISGYNMYFPSIPFCVMIAYCLVRGCRKLYQGSVENTRRWPAERLAFGVALVGGGIIVVMLLAASNKTLMEFNDGRVARSLYSQIDDLVATHPEIDHIVIYNFPGIVTNFSGSDEQQLDEKNLKAWVDISFPDRSVQIDVKSYNDSTSYPASLDFGNNWEDKNYLAVYIGAEGKL